MATMPSAREDIPAHVPESLVRPFPFTFGAICDEDPFNVSIPRIHEGPDVFFARNLFAGGVPAWVFTRAADLREIYLDTDHFSNLSIAPFAAIIGESWRLIPTEVDPPEHSRYRLMFNPMFAPKVINRLTDKIELYARQGAQAVADKGRADLLRDFCQPFPVTVFMEMMGLPQYMMPQLLSWAHGLIHPANETVLQDTARAVADYLRSEIAKRRAAPSEDFISYGLVAEIDGQRLSENDILGFCYELFLAGLDTVSTTIAFQLLHLARNPEHQAALRNDPGLIPNAVEELTRAYSPALTFRTCKKRIEKRGVVIQPGDKVLMCTGLAGRDPHEFEEPNAIRFDRHPRHIAFAYGPHVCIGAHLARIEMKTAMREVLDAIPFFTLQEDARIQYSAHLVMQPSAVPVIWQA
jgi:cytochrome P450